VVGLGLTAGLDEKWEAMEKVGAELIKMRAVVKGDDWGDRGPKEEAA
jgi:hypothetical protein